MLPFKNVVLGVSGGVDSAVAALILKKKGFNVSGIFMKNWDLIDENGTCNSSKDLEDAKFVCNKLNIPFHEVNFVKEYWSDVFETFLNDYQKGLTPNPDILCNKFIKFKAFYNHAIKNLKADAIATGHYANTSFGNFLQNYKPGVNVKLLKAKDIQKDQTFFLSQVPQESLRKTMFPLGNLKKEEIKKIAWENGLGKIAKKPESMGICFIGSRNFRKFMSEYVTPKPGKFIDLNTGKEVGKHDGVHLYTLGQRSCIGGLSDCLYVVSKEAKNAEILVSLDCHHPAQYKSLIFTETPHWIDEPPDLTYKAEATFRYHHGTLLKQCDIVELESGGLLIRSLIPVRAATPGQFVVIYKDNECLGSAKIIKLGPSEFSLGNEIPEDCKKYNNTILDSTCEVDSV